MYLTLPCYSSSHQPRFWKLPQMLLTSGAGGVYWNIEWWLRIDPFKWSPTSMSNTYQVFCHLHLLWMCILFLPGLPLIFSTKLLEVSLSTCICPCHVTAALLSQAFGSFPLIPGTSKDANQSIVWCLRLKSHSSGLPHQYQTYIRRFTTFT